MKSKTIKKTLMCELTEKERREYGISLATTLGDMEEIEAQKKREMDHFKDRIAGLQAKADELSRKVRDGKEWRDVDCQVLYSTPDKEHKQTIRMDTGETVQTERMTETDLQLVMPLGEGIAKYVKAVLDDNAEKLDVLKELMEKRGERDAEEEGEDLMIHDDAEGPQIMEECPQYSDDDGLPAKKLTAPKKSKKPQPEGSSDDY